MDPPTVLTEPADVTVYEGQEARFTVVASGMEPMTYQWQSRATGTDPFADIAGATAATYTVVTTTLSDNGRQFQVRVANVLRKRGLAVGSPSPLSATCFNWSSSEDSVE